MHGRSLPPSGRDLLDEFAAALAGWEWDVALLQEVPPWWPPALASALGAEHRLVLTSRNALLPARRALARRWPDLMKSNGGGANAILARRDRIVADRSVRLRRVPERRYAHGARLGCGVWVVNLHGTAHVDGAAAQDGANAAEAALRWSDGEPVVLGGDFNLRAPRWPPFTHIAGNDVDHILVAGAVQAASDAELPDRGRLSDHAPVSVAVRLTDR
jgi:endonuclease/exonuclease/phosphatase family metal-dependent hydrolase